MTTTRNTRRFLSLSACATFAATLVGIPGGARADTIPFASLPLAALPSSTATPPTLPATIPATERVDGIFVALQPDKTRKAMEDKNGYHYVSIFTSDKAAQAYTTEGSYAVTYTDNRSAPRVCISSGGRSFSQRLTTLHRVRPYVPPPPSAQTIARLKALHRWPPPAPKPPKTTTPSTPPHDDMQRVTIEKLTVAGDSAKVDVTDAVVNLKTLGTRLLGSTTTTLSRVSSGPNGMGIFASRDDKGRVQFLVTSPELPTPELDADRQRQLEGLSSTADRVMVDTPSGGASESGCGHVRFTMDAVKPGAGEMATVLATAFLPPSSDPDENPDGSTDEPQSQGTEGDDSTLATAANGQRRSQRARAVAVNVSLSQLASEPSPLLSLTLGWAGKDTHLSF